MSQSPSPPTRYGEKNEIPIFNVAAELHGHRGGVMSVCAIPGRATSHNGYIFSGAKVTAPHAESTHRAGAIYFHMGGSQDKCVRRWELQAEARSLPLSVTRAPSCVGLGLPRACRHCVLPNPNPEPFG